MYFLLFYSIFFNMRCQTKISSNQELHIFHIIIDIRKGNGLATLFNTIHDFGSVILNKPETHIAQLAMLIMRKRN